MSIQVLMDALDDQAVETLTCFLNPEPDLLSLEFNIEEDPEFLDEFDTYFDEGTVG